MVLSGTADDGQARRLSFMHLEPCARVPTFGEESGYPIKIALASNGPMIPGLLTPLRIKTGSGDGGRYPSARISANSELHEHLESRWEVR